MAATLRPRLPAAHRGQPPDLASSASPEIRAGRSAPRARAGGRRSLTGSPSFMRIVRTCVSTVFSVSHSRRAMPALVRPSAISDSTSRSRGGELVERARRLRRADQRRHDLRVERGAALADAARGVEEVVDVEHAVLQQVAEAAARGDELDDVARLDVLGEDEHGGARGASGGSPPPRACPRRRSRAACGRRRRRARARARRRARAASRRRRRGRRPRGRRPRAARRAPRAAARCPRRSRRARQLHGDPRARAGRALERERAALGGDAVGHPREPAARRRRGAADPVVGDDEPQDAVARASVCTVTRDGERVLDRVGERLAGDEVRDRLDLRRRAVAASPRARPAPPRRARGPRAPRSGPRRAAAGARPRRSSAGRAIVAATSSTAASSAGREDPRLAGQRALQPPQHDAERHEPLLRAVVQVALEPAALLVAGLRDPRRARTRPRRAAAAARPAGGRARPRPPRRRAPARSRSGRRASAGSCSSTPTSRSSRPIGVRARPSSGSASSRRPRRSA